MFGKPRDENMRNTPIGPLANTIGKDTVIEGEIKTEGNLRIDGRVKGIVNSKAKVVIGPSGVLDGDLYCKSADIAGTVNGKMQVSEIVQLKSSSTANGDIVTGKIIVEADAKILGGLDVGGLKQASSGTSTILQKEAV